MQIAVDRPSLTAIGKELAVHAPKASTCIKTISCFNRSDGLSSSSSDGSCFFDKLGYLSQLIGNTLSLISDSMQQLNCTGFFVFLYSKGDIIGAAWKSIILFSYEPELEKISAF